MRIKRKKKKSLLGDLEDLAQNANCNQKNVTVSQIHETISLKEWGESP